MNEFRSHLQYWDFAGEVARRWRYARPKAVGDFVEAVRATCMGRSEDIPLESCFFRAQNGCDWCPGVVDEGRPETPAPFSVDRMRPQQDRAVEGRVNPKGIPCLYVASAEKIAVSEMRPWIGAYVTIARLRTIRPLKVVNCTGAKRGKRVLLYAKPPSQKELKRVVWDDIDRAFAEPVERTNCFASYASTQVLAEIFREEGFDGVAYRSNFGGGYNVAFFDLKAAEVVNKPWVVKVSALGVKFGRVH